MDRKEAIEVIREYYPSSGKDLNEALETLIPELKESDDEMIRKVLIHFFSKGAEYDSSTNGIKDRNILAWLEKQGEQKPAEWGKEDEDMLACCEIAIDFFKNIGKNSSGHPHPNYFDLDEKIYPERVIEWLKSLKDRIQPQSKQEWSEEDEKTTQRIVDTIMKYAISPHSIINGDKPNLEYAKEFESWLKSLKFRIQPQWKPSDEQMTALSIIKDSGNSHEHEVLDSLYYDLKKLIG